MLQKLLRSVSVALALAVLTIGGFRLLVRQPASSGLEFKGSLRADPQRLKRDVTFLAETVAPRDLQHPENLQRAAAYIERTFSEAGARVGLQQFAVRGSTYVNVIGRLGPRGQHPLIIGAHYDAFGEFGTNPGADDNASGAAGLMELARLLKGQAIKRPLELVAFSTEEPPDFASSHMGSAIHAGSLRRSGEQPTAMICLEMIGYYSPEQHWPSALLQILYPERGDFIAVVGRWEDRHLAVLIKRAIMGARSVPVVSYSGPYVAGMDASDHRNYWAQGITAVMVTDTAFVRNPNYHASGDRVETLDFVKMAGVVDGVANAVYWAAER